MASDSSESSPLSLRAREILYYRKRVNSADNEFDPSRENPIKCHAWRNTPWLWGMKGVQKERIRDYLLQLDQEHRVDLTEPRNMEIREGLTSIMESLVTKIGQLEPRFVGKLIQVGSVNNNTKTNDLDEFDFIYELTLDTLIGIGCTFNKADIDNGCWKIIVDLDKGKGGLDQYNLFELPEDEWLQIDSLLDLNGFNGRLNYSRAPVTDGQHHVILKLNRSTDIFYYSNALMKDGDNFLLNSEHVGLAIYFVIQKAMSELELPKGWCHGGVNRPNFSGLRIKLPALLLQFDYLGDGCTKKAVKISVDFSPVIQIKSVSNFTKDNLIAYLLANGYINTSWLQLNRTPWKTFYSQGEEAFLAEYAMDSVPKKVIRMCKCLTDILKLDRPKLLHHSSIETLLNILNNKEKTEPGFFTNWFSATRKYRLTRSTHTSHFATFKDIGEIEEKFEAVSSYMIKRTVMTLMVLDKDQGKTWMDEDIPDIVISIYLIINDMIMMENLMTKIRTEETKTEHGFSYKEAPRWVEMSEQPITPPSFFEEMVIPLTFDGNQGEEDCEHKGHDADEDFKAAAAIGIDDKSAPKPPRFYRMLSTAIQKKQCFFLNHLCNREKYTVKPIHIGLDVDISQIFQFLEYVSHGDKEAKVTVRRYEDPGYSDVEENKKYVTKAALKEQLEGVGIQT